ncbi:hypothetical protein CEP52_003897 [Fusarium oligoseptatum]|uniref:DUF6546 domain-containing protein n=1 Tax=Fusarium oligoseptatum TaxID=2604345 RepID=A0A428U6D5_9HYPO|nr:hypothetical protein CEP52_003897 [Fusarium oligoseptatum]
MSAILPNAPPSVEIGRNTSKIFLFRKITVHQKDLAGIHKISPCRTERIQHLWLRIELSPHGCRRKNGFILDRALCNMLRVLRRWKGRNSSQPSGGLTLEISTHSPSDLQHEFQNISFDDSENNDEDTEVCKTHDPKHGWVDGHRTRQPDDMPVYDLFHLWEPGKPRIEKVEWSAPVVKHLLIRRQARRQIPPTTLECLFDRLPRLESLNLELWTMYGGLESVGDYITSTLLQRHFPRRVQRVTLFQDFDEDIDSMFSGGSPHWVGPDKIPNPAVGESLAGLKSQRRLCVSFIADAYDFFEALHHRRRDGAWRNLTHFSMTSLALRSETPPSHVQRLLMMAAYAACRFPSLEIMELWYGRRGEACLFRFSRSLDGAFEIFRSGTWELPLSSEVVEAWTKICNLRRGRSIMIRDMERIDHQQIMSHGDAIHYLGLMADVVHPTSLRQIRREAQHYGPYPRWKPPRELYHDHQWLTSIIASTYGQP